MKILFLARLFAPHQGGVEKHLAAVIKELPAEAQITVVTEQFDTQLALHQKIGRVEVWRIPVGEGRHKKWQIWCWWLRHLQLCGQADVIHIHDVFFWLLPFRLVLWSKQIFMTFHGYEGHDPSWREIGWHCLAAFLTEGSIAVGRFHQKWYGVNSDFYTYGGVDLLESHKNLHLPSAKKLVFIGRLASDTGILEYLEAVKKLLLAGESVTLDIYGDGPLRAECQKIANQFKQSIIIKGSVQVTPELLAKYSIALVSGYLSILEALTVGLKVIALTSSQMEIKSDYLYMTPFANWIIIANSAEEVAAAVMTKVSLPAEAKSWAQAQTWSKVAELYTQLWQQ